jgi:hypothetical protein
MVEMSKINEIYNTLTIFRTAVLVISDFKKNNKRLRKIYGNPIS